MKPGPPEIKSAAPDRCYIYEIITQIQCHITTAFPGDTRQQSLKLGMPWGVRTTKNNKCSALDFWTRLSIHQK